MCYKYYNLYTITSPVLALYTKTAPVFTIYIFSTWAVTLLRTNVFPCDRENIIKYGRIARFP